MKALTEKYMMLKNAALKSEIIDSVRLAFTKDEAFDLVEQAISTEMIVFPIEAKIMDNTDSVAFSIFIVDKVNNIEEEFHVLNSWDTSLTALRYIADSLNYKEDEEVLIDEIELGVYQNDNKTETATLVNAVIDMSLL